MPRPAHFLLLLGLGCTTETVITSETCALDVDLATADASVGELVRITGGPMTTTYDSKVLVGGVAALVQSIQQNAACTQCESCRADAGCGTCDYCSTCVDACNSCESSLDFIVPNVTGLQPVVLFNLHGQSSAVNLNIAGGSDTSLPDTADTGPHTGHTDLPGHTDTDASPPHTDTDTDGSAPDTSSPDTSTSPADTSNDTSPPPAP